MYSSDISPDNLFTLDWVIISSLLLSKWVTITVAVFQLKSECFIFFSAQVMMIQKTNVAWTEHAVL